LQELKTGPRKLGKAYKSCGDAKPQQIYEVPTRALTRGEQCTKSQNKKEQYQEQRNPPTDENQ
jgi:hypothetical protein